MEFSKHRDALVQSGIAGRMIETLKKYKGTNDPEITFGVEDCDFRVKRTLDGFKSSRFDGVNKSIRENHRIVQSGIAGRMIETLKKYKGTEDPEITFGVEDCNFTVEQTFDSDFYSLKGRGERGGERRIQVIIEKPTGHTQAFSVEAGKPFGAGDEQPLTQAQFEVILNILEEGGGIQVIIETPTGDTQAFRVEAGEPFGAGDEQPLTQAQFEVILNILKG